MAGDHRIRAGINLDGSVVLLNPSLHTDPLEKFLAQLVAAGIIPPRLVRWP